MTTVTKKIIEAVNKDGRIGTLATADKNGQPNIAYFGSPQVQEDGTIVMGLGNNRSLKNLEENPQAVFLSIEESPVTFTTPGHRLYLKAQVIDKEGEVLAAVKEAIAAVAGEDAANMMVAGVVFDVTDVRALVDMG